MNIETLILAYIFIFGFSIIGIVLEKLNIFNHVEAFLALSGICLVLVSVLCVSTGINYRTGHNETISADGKTVKVTYEYSNQETKDNNIDYIGFTLSFFTACLFMFSGYRVKKNKEKNKEEENY